MKAFSSPAPRKILLVVILVALLATALTACSEDIPVTPAGYTASGRAELDGEPLAGVAVFVNGEIACYTDEYGVYTARELEYGDTLAFALEGYSFSPQYYTVRGNDYALNTVATADGQSPPEPGPDTEPEPEPGPDTEPEPEPEPEPVVLDAPHGFLFCYDTSFAPVFAFLLPSSAESVSVKVTTATGVLTGTTGPRNDALTLSSDDNAVSVQLAQVTDDTEEGTLLSFDASALVRLAGGKFSLTLISRADGAADSAPAEFHAEFADGAPAVGSLEMEGNTLFWQAEFLPQGCTFAVTLNGVTVGSTTSSEFDLSEYAELLTGGASLCVVALCDGAAIALSPVLTV